MNRLSRELSALRLAQQLAAAAAASANQNGGSPSLSGSGGSSNGTGTGVNGDGTQSPTLLRLPNPLAPSSEDMLEAMRRENEHLRNRLVDTEREFIRITRLNEIYREELIQHRRRVCTHVLITFVFCPSCLRALYMLYSWVSPSTTLSAYQPTIHTSSLRIDGPPQMRLRLPHPSCYRRSAAVAAAASEAHMQCVPRRV